MTRAPVPKNVQVVPKEVVPFENLEAAFFEELAIECIQCHGREAGRVRSMLNDYPTNDQLRIINSKQNMSHGKGKSVSVLECFLENLQSWNLNTMKYFVENNLISDPESVVTGIVKRLFRKPFLEVGDMEPKIEAIDLILEECESLSLTKDMFLKIDKLRTYLDNEKGVFNMTKGQCVEQRVGVSELKVKVAALERVIARQQAEMTLMQDLVDTLPLEKQEMRAVVGRAEVSERGGPLDRSPSTTVSGVDAAEATSSTLRSSACEGGGRGGEAGPARSALSQVPTGGGGSGGGAGNHGDR